MLSPSRINPNLSASMQILENFDFNKTPLAPIGCKAIIHERPENKGTWDSHGKLAYYIDIAEKHYRNYKCYVPETHATRISDTVDFFPKMVQMPKTSSEDRLAAVLEDLKEVLKNPHPKTPFLDKGTPSNDAIAKLESIFGPPKNDNNNRPRVNETKLPMVQQVPRVAAQQRLETIAEEPTQHPIGTVIRKKIGQALQQGTVTRYDDDREYYWIDYENGDSKEMRHRYIKIQML